jgi:hypothetical protein
LPLLKKYSQSEDGLSPSECGYHEHSRAFYILQQSRLVEFEGINKDQKDEGKWHLTELGYACVETLLAEELYEEKMRLGTTSLYASLPFTESVSTETRRASAL